MPNANTRHSKKQYTLQGDIQMTYMNPIEKTLQYSIPPFRFCGGGACQTFKLNKRLLESPVKFSEITIINVLLMLAARWFGEREVHLTKSGQPRWRQQVVGRNGRCFPMGFLVVTKDWRSSSHYMVYDRRSLKGFQKGIFSLRDDTISV